MVCVKARFHKKTPAAVETYFDPTASGARLHSSIHRYFYKLPSRPRLTQTPLP
jgi:hypothetical protein